MARVGILTGGGDCRGLNAVIRAVTRRMLDLGWEVAAVREGWRGLVDGLVHPLERRDVSGILPRGGTILGTSRTNPYKLEGAVEKVLETFEREGLTWYTPGSDWTRSIVFGILIAILVFRPEGLLGERTPEGG